MTTGLTQPDGEVVVEIQMSFIYKKELGYAHYENEQVAVFLITSRPPQDKIPGGSLLIGEVLLANEEIRWIKHPGMMESQVHIPPRYHQTVVQMARAASADCCSPIPFPEKRMAFVHNQWRDEIYIFSYTEEDAAGFAFLKGLRVEEHLYPGCGGGVGKLGGRYWQVLWHRQQEGQAA
jgi:hypothetical protein